MLAKNADGPDFKAGFDLNNQYLLMLSPDNLLYSFRATANISNPGTSYGGWESPTVEVRGQFVGHYLSALAYVTQNTGREDMRARSRLMVSELKTVQDAFGDGYLSAFPKEHFDRLETLIAVWAPYYVIHKIMQGLLDQHILAKDPQALDMVESMASYFCNRVEAVIKARGEEHWHLVLNTEFGGMNEVLYNMYSETGRRRYADCAARFDKPAFLEPLLTGRDPLPGLHANTHLAQVNGFAARFDALGDAAGATAVHNFFGFVQKYHSFATGGNNWAEYWHPESTMADALNAPRSGAATQESCTQYNMLKIARRMFAWSGSAAIADYYELAMLNGVIGIQRKPHSHDHGEAVSWAGDPGAVLRAGLGQGGNDPGPGVMIYYLPQFAGEWKGEHVQSWTGWGDPFNTFWCCYGSGVESFSKLADSIYFHRSGNDTRGATGSSDGDTNPLPELFVNQLVSSRLAWRQQGCTINQTADLYSSETVIRSRLHIATDEAGGRSRFLLKWRIPGWTNLAGVTVAVNGKNVTCSAPPVEGRVPPPGAEAAAGFYCDLGPDWVDGDTVESSFPLRARTQSVNDLRPENLDLKAVVVGPWVMAGLTDGRRDIVADSAAIAGLIVAPSNEGLVSLRVLPTEEHGADSGAEAGDGSLVLLSRQPGTDALLHLPHPLAASRAAAMDATFRLVPALRAAAPDGSTEGEAQLVSLESMSRPGQHLCLAPGGGLALQGLGAGESAAGGAAVFGLGPCPNGDRACLLDSRMQAIPGLQLIEPAAPRYPHGSRILRGADTQYLLVPIGQVIDEHYTTHFEFKTPPATAEA